MPAGAERDPLLGNRRIGFFLEVEPPQLVDIDQHVARRRLSRKRMHHPRNLQLQNVPDSATDGPCAATDKALPRRCSKGKAIPQAAPMAAPLSVSVK